MNKALFATLALGAAVAFAGSASAEKLKATGVEVVLAYPGKEDTKYGSPWTFLIEKLTAK